MLERGEKLDTLVAKSSDLTERSKNFYKTAKKMKYVRAARGVRRAACCVRCLTSVLAAAAVSCCEQRAGGARLMCVRRDATPRCVRVAVCIFLGRVETPCLSALSDGLPLRARV